MASKANIKKNCKGRGTANGLHRNTTFLKDTLFQINLWLFDFLNLKKRIKINKIHFSTITLVLPSEILMHSENEAVKQRKNIYEKLEDRLQSIFI